MTIYLPSYSFTTGDKMRVDNLAVSNVENDKTTVEFLMKWDGISNVMPFGFSNYYDLWFANDFFGFNTGQGDVFGIESTNLKNKWVHVTAVFNNGDIAQNKLYINGILQELSQRIPDKDTSANKFVSSTFYLSGWNTTSNYAFSGQLSNLRIWRGERTQEQIISTPFTLDQTSDPSLLGFWRLDKNMNDESDYRNHGINLGSAKYKNEFITDTYLESLLPEGEWITNSGDWTINANNQFVMSKNSSIHSYLVRNKKYNNFTIESTFFMTSDDDGIGFTFDFKNNNDYKQLVYSGGGINGKNVITMFHVVNGVRKQIYVNNTVPVWELSTNLILKLEVAYNTLSFFIKGEKVFDYELAEEHDGAVGYYTYSQQCTIKSTNLKENIVNKMKAIFIRYAVSESEIFTEIEVKQKDNSEINTEIIPRAIGTSTKNTEINIVYADSSEILVEIQPYGFVQIPAEIEIRPHNKMWAIYEVQQPPIVTTVYTPVKDAFTREMVEYQSINYGSNNSMVVGKKNSDITRSYVQFNFNDFSPSYVLTDVKLRLYYEIVAPTNVKLELFTARESWLENSITHLNRPTPYEFVASDFTINEELAYIEFDARSAIENWIKGERINNGFIIRVENETVEGQVIFNTRESKKPPELIIKHYDSRIFSSGRSQLPAEINIVNAGLNEKETEIEVTSAFSFDSIDVELRVHVFDVPFDEDIPVEITVNKPQVVAEITPSFPEDSEKLTEISVWYRIEERLETELAVTRTQVNTEIFSAYGNNIDVEITVPKYDDSKTDVEVSVTRDKIFAIIEARLINESKILTEITVKRDSVESEISVIGYGEEDINVEIDIDRKFYSRIETEILISKDSVKTEITPRVNDEDKLQTEISVTRNKVNTEIFVKHGSSINTEITVDVVSKRYAEITATRPQILTEITPRVNDESELDAEIHVYHYNIVETEIEARKVSQVETEIEAKSVSQIDTEIIITKKYIYAEIVVPYVADYDLPTEISPRVLMVDNIETVITIGQKRGAYVFIL